MAKDIKSKKYTGVYYRVLEDKSKTYYILYKDPITNKKVRLKIGSSKEGINETYCNNKRLETLSKLRLGEDTNLPILKKKTQHLTLNDIANKFFEYKELTGYASLKDRKSRYNKHYGNSLGKMFLYTITKNDVLAMQKKLIKEDYSTSTINSTIQQGSTIFNYAIKEEIYKGINPFSNIPTLKVSNERKRWLSHNDIDLLKKAITKDPILYLFTTLSLTTGGRLEGILNIKKKDINFNDRVISIYDFKNKEYYHGFLTDETHKLLLEQTNNLKNNDFVISYDNGSKVLKKKIQRKLKPILDDLFNKNISTNDRLNRIVIHSFRHSFASLLAINGTPIFTIQKLMNHKDIKHTLRYAKLSPQSKTNEVMKVFN